MNELALFAGAGGGILGSRLLGWRTVCAVEFDPYARDVLLARQNDGCLEPFPVWDDVRTFDGRAWRGVVDVVSGGFPCQDISAAGQGAGIAGEKSGLWSEMARIICDVRPRYAFIENSPMLTSRGFDRVLCDIASMGFDAEWGVVGAHHAGAPHKRDRIWILACDAHSHSESVVTLDDEAPRLSGVAANAQRIKLWDESRRRHGKKRQGASQFANDGTKEFVADAQFKRLERAAGGGDDRARRQAVEPSGGGSAQFVADADGAQCERDERAIQSDAEHADARRAGWWQTEPDVGRVADGVAARMDRLRCIGNGQVPSVAALAWRTLINQRAGIR